MRIVVPISKALFEKMKSNKNHIEVLCYHDMYLSTKAVSKGKPLTNKDTIKELENIKDELLSKINGSNIFGSAYVDVKDINEIFDKRIKALKGENK